MKTIILGSGSKGNSTLLVTKNQKILIDVGFSYPKMKLLLSEYLISPEDIDGILITHTHKDHIQGLSTFVKKHMVNVYANPTLFQELIKVMDSDNMILVDDEFMIGDLEVSLLHTSHDALGSVGFIVNDGVNNMVYITDTGYINQYNLERMVDKNLYVIESNHDIEMLMDGPYPYILKQRVVSDKGHLSNEMTGNYLKSIIGKDTKKIVLAHLSETNNTPELAFETICNMLNLEENNITLLVAKQDESIDVGEF